MGGRHSYLALCRVSGEQWLFSKKHMIHKITQPGRKKPRRTLSPQTRGVIARLGPDRAHTQSWDQSCTHHWQLSCTGASWGRLAPTEESEGTCQSPPTGPGTEGGPSLHTSWGWLGLSPYHQQIMAFGTYSADLPPKQGKQGPEWASLNQLLSPRTLEIFGA